MRPVVRTFQADFQSPEKSWEHGSAPAIPRSSASAQAEASLRKTADRRTGLLALRPPGRCSVFWDPAQAQPKGKEMQRAACLCFCLASFKGFCKDLGRRGLYRKFRHVLRMDVRQRFHFKLFQTRLAAPACGVPKRQSKPLSSGAWLKYCTMQFVYVGTGEGKTGQNKDCH